MSEDRVTRLEQEAALAERMEAERDAAVSETRAWYSLQTDTAVALEAALKGKAEDETAEVIEGYRVRLDAALARARAEGIRADIAEKERENLQLALDDSRRNLDALVAAATTAREALTLQPPRPVDAWNILFCAVRVATVRGACETLSAAQEPTVVGVRIVANPAVPVGEWWLVHREPAVTLAPSFPSLAEDFDQSLAGQPEGSA